MNAISDIKNKEQVIEITPIPPLQSGNQLRVVKSSHVPLKAILALAIILLNILSNLIIDNTSPSLTADSIYMYILFISGIAAAISCIVVARYLVRKHDRFIQFVGIFTSLLFAIGFFFFNLASGINVAVRGYPD